MKRRDFVKLSLIASWATVLGANSNTKREISLFPAFSKALAISPILEAQTINEVKEYNLNVQEGSVAFLNGAKTKTFGVNSDFLGPTIRVSKGDEIKINVHNALKENTVMHWHGLKVAGKNDGGPNRNILPNNTWSSSFKIEQRSSMCWYHPHTFHKTGEQVFKGIAGLFIIEDEDSKKLDIPKEYGVDDIPLVFQDRRFDMQGQFLYVQSMHDRMMGVSGNFSLVNGVLDPYLKVQPKLMRFRVLNGSNSRVYRFMFNDNRYFHQIAGDASFLPQPVKMNTLLLSPGERAEILVDFSNDQEKEIFFGDDLSNKPLLKFLVQKGESQKSEIPKSLVDITEYSNLPKDLNIREFEINMRMGWVGINGKQMDMNRIDEIVPLNKTEIWRIKNPQRMVHPMHIHGCSFKILSRNNKKPYMNESGLKDTVLIYGNETVDVAVKFEHESSKKYPYMFHCHILEHEDAGMMQQFVVKKG